MKRISELPADIRAVAEQRRKDQDRSDGEDKLMWAFHWDKAPEGYNIWLYVDMGNYQPFRDFHANKEVVAPKPSTSTLEQLHIWAHKISYLIEQGNLKEAQSLLSALDWSLHEAIDKETTQAPQKENT